ncbi:GNAT family N-acetyltransferase [Nocardiopsis sp. NPDC058789]|uniref:GNAT family N-acetyltransferase n=1 Tax=Nocardiopsis sp. NPDC058789 TaxID=3346634 RepID=UPI00366DAD00
MFVRRAVPDDGPAIAGLLMRAAARFEVKDYPLGSWPDGIEVLVAVEDDRLVGWVEGVLDGAYTGPGAPVPPPHGYVLGIVVDPLWRRLGAGRALLDGFVAVARAAGVRWVFLFPEEGEEVEGRVEFLRAAGFTPVDDPDEKYPAMGRSSC